MMFKTTDSGLLCTAVSLVAFLIVVGLFYMLLADAVMSNPAIQNLSHLLGN